MDVSTRAMLVALKITAWSSSKLDKAVTNEVLDNHNAADKKAGRFTKALIGKEAMAEIKKVSTEARQLHYELTLPWSQDGSRILPTAMFSKYDGDMKQLKDKYEAAVRDFLAVYPQEVADARKRLGALWNEADYPEASEIEGKFSWEYVFSPLPNGDDFRLNVSKEMADELKKQYEDHANSQIKEANKHLWQKAYDAISHMVTKLDEYGEKASDKENGRIKTFHSTLVTNIKELAESLPALNITQDPELERLSKEMMEHLAEFDAEDLKADTLVRERVSKSAKKMVKEINDKLGGF